MTTMAESMFPPPKPTKRQVALMVVLAVAFTALYTLAGNL